MYIDEEQRRIILDALEYYLYNEDASSLDEHYFDALVKTLDIIKGE